MFKNIFFDYRDKEIDEEIERQKRKKKSTSSGLGPLPAPTTSDKKYNVRTNTEYWTESRVKMLALFRESLLFCVYVSLYRTLKRLRSKHI